MQSQTLDVIQFIYVACKYLRSTVRKIVCSSMAISYLRSLDTCQKSCPNHVVRLTFNSFYRSDGLTRILNLLFCRSLVQAIRYLIFHYCSNFRKLVFWNLSFVCLQYFWRRRRFVAKPLLKEGGIGSVILENPFYGLRRPEEQQ